MIIKPTYYDKFRCIAGDCDFTCCQEWKIAVDDKTAQEWKSTCPPEGIKSRRKNLEQFTQFKDGQRVISLENHVCPFLDANKLCMLVKQYGDEILSETCTIFPREKHEFGDGRVEKTLMPCCPAVIDLMNEEENFKLCEDGDAESENEIGKLLEIRQLMMDILSDTGMSCEEALLVCFYLLSEFYNDENLTVSAANDACENILNAIRGMNFDAGEHYGECYELFFDLTENYCKEGVYEKQLNEIVNNVHALKKLDSYDEDFQTAWHDFDGLFHKILAQEVFSDLVNSASEMSDLLIRMQWIGLEYALMRHVCFIEYHTSGKLNYPAIRTYIVLVSRMMGYEEDDIYEYLEGFFEEMIWEWGYFALVVGK